MYRVRVLTAVAVAGLLVPAGSAAGQNYPGPGDPGNPGKARGKGGTITVCKRGCDYRKIQKAVNAASGRNTIKVRGGKYREA